MLLGFVTINKMDKIEKNLYLASLANYFPSLLLRDLLENFRVEELLNFKKANLADNLPEKYIGKILEWQQFDIDKLARKLQKHQIRLISCFDEEYPKALWEIPDKPIIFYLKGDCYFQ
jgi:predicted Rossmann fold nucleotide-binding protein DprA/Smf involved in DNA uptake